jgi:hypothetical protein
MMMMMMMLMMMMLMICLRVQKIGCGILGQCGLMEITRKEEMK